MTEELTQDELHDFRKAISEYDNGNGLHIRNVIHALRALNQNPTQKDVNEAVHHMEEENRVNDDETIELEDLVQIYNQLKKSEKENMEELRLAFQTFDVDGSGYIDKEELRRILTNTGEEPLEDDEVDSIFQEYDTNEDGQLCYNEIVPLLCQINKEKDEMEQEEDDY